MTTHIRGRTVICRAIVKDENGNLYNPQTSMKITITDPHGVAVVDKVDMTEVSTGIYTYDFQTTKDHIVGTYTCLYVAVNADRVSNDISTFELI